MYPPSPALAASMNNLGSALRAQGRGKESENWIRQAISTWELVLGPNHPNVAAGLTNLAVSLQMRARYDESARLLDRARSIDEQSFPAGHPRIGIDLSRAGALAKSRKRYRQAEDLLLRADAILEGSLPATDQEIGAALLNLADVFRLEKKLESVGKDVQTRFGDRDRCVGTGGPAFGSLAGWLRERASATTRLCRSGPAGNSSYKNSRHSNPRRVASPPIRKGCGLQNLIRALPTHRIGQKDLARSAGAG